MSATAPDLAVTPSRETSSARNARAAELLDQVAHPGEAAVLAVAELRVQLGDRPAELDGVVGADEQVEVAREPLAVREPAAGEHLEAHLVAEARWAQCHIVDLAARAVLRAAGHRELELPRQVGVRAVAGEEPGDRAGHRQRLEHLVAIDAAYLAARHVPCAVTARLDRGEPDLGEATPHLGDRREREPVQLDRLARRQVAEVVAEQRVLRRTLAELARDEPDLARLGGARAPRRGPSRAA